MAAALEVPQNKDDDEDELAERLLQSLSIKTPRPSRKKGKKKKEGKNNGEDPIENSSSTSGRRTSPRGRWVKDGPRGMKWIAPSRKRQGKGSDGAVQARGANRKNPRSQQTPRARRVTPGPPRRTAAGT